MLSVIIPTLNAQSRLPDTLATLVPAAIDGLVKEVIVVDGGSEDATRQLADDAGATVVQTERGRGGQLKRGAAEARGEWLLFLHADTVPEDGWIAEVRQFVTGPNDRAAAFRFALDDDAVRARILEGLVRLRCAIFSLPYGDQGLLISKALYNEIGGFQEIPLMEDVDIVRRIGRQRLILLKSKALTAADRYQKYGYIIRSFRNVICLCLFFLRVPPKTLARLYG